MAIESKFIYAPKLDGFKVALGNAESSTNGLWGIVPDNAIAFIEDKKEIWSHGKFYGAESYLKTLGTSGFLALSDGVPTVAPPLKMWGRYYDNELNEVNGEITLIEGPYYTYSESTKKWSEDPIQSPAKINLMVGDPGYQKLGWHILGPEYGGGTSNYNFRLTYSGTNGNETAYLTLSNQGALTIGKSILVSGSSTTTGSINYGIITNDANGNIIASSAYLQGKYLNKTSSYFPDSVNNFSWNAILKYKNGVVTSLKSTLPAFIVLDEKTKNTDGWRPWISGATSDNASWGLGLTKDSFIVGRIDNSETTNKLSQSWEFKADGFVYAKGYAVPGHTSGESVGLLKSDGTIDTNNYLTEQIPVPVFTGATSTLDGTSGLVPAPLKKDYNKQSNTYLSATGNWQTLGTMCYEAASNYYTKNEIDAIKVDLDLGKISLTTTWNDLINLNTLGTSNSLSGGSYLLIIDYRGFIYSGVFSYSSSSTDVEEIPLHRSGNSVTEGVGRLFARLNQKTIQVAVTKEDSNCTSFHYKIKLLVTI